MSSYSLTLSAHLYVFNFHDLQKTFIAHTRESESLELDEYLSLSLLRRVVISACDVGGMVEGGGGADGNDVRMNVRILYQETKM